MKTMKLNIDLGKYVITGTKHDLILSERGIIKEGENAGKETLSRIGYYSKFEHLVKELCNREILLSQAQTLQDIQQHIETLGVSLAWLLTSSWRVNHERTCIQSQHSSGRNDYSPTRKANAIERGIA